MKKWLLYCIVFPLVLSAQTKHINTSVLVVGGGTGGTAAAIQCARNGVATLVVEQTPWLGGMLTAAGVSCTDGNHALPSGMWQEFREALYKHYGTRNLAAGWVSETCFEPHVGDSIFKAWAANEKKLQVLYGWYFDTALKENNKVVGASFVNTKGERMEVMASITVDATDLGDVFASAGAAYDLGTENSSQSGERIAPGKTKVIQDMTWAATLKDFGKGADRTLSAPAGYDPTRYYCSTGDAPCNGKPYAFNTTKVLDYGKLRVTKGTADKFMLNWPANGNDTYLDVVEMRPVEREKAFIKARNQTLGFLYFLQTTLGQKQIGLATDEMDSGMAFIPYHREGRRVRGKVRLNIDHLRTPYDFTMYRTGIAVGDYPVDHHHGQYPGKVPPIPFPKIPSFNIPLGALIPEEIEGLIVCDKGISVSNIANGSTRLQPVVLLTGQAAGVLAAKAVKESIEPCMVAVNAVQDELLKNKCYLMPFVDIRPDDMEWEAVQRVGALGILKGVGKSEGWANKMFFFPDSLVTCKEFRENVTEIYAAYGNFGYDKHQYLNLEDLVSWAVHFGTANELRPTGESKIEILLRSYPLPENRKSPLTRKQVAMVVNCILQLAGDINTPGKKWDGGLKVNYVLY